MRLGEASALLWSDIDFTTGLCSITKTLYYHNQSDYKFTKPKTRAAIRSTGGQMLPQAASHS